MRADFHTHTSFSPDSLLTPDLLIRAAVGSKIGCVAVTDHNTIQGAVYLKKNSALPFQIIIGEEISTRQGEVIGLFLQETIPDGLDVYQTIEIIAEQGGLSVLPHPCDRLRHHAIRPELLPEIIALVDIVEGYNGRTIFKADDRKALSLAKEGAKPVIAGSDAHTVWELGRFGLELPEFESPAELITALRSARLFGRRANPAVHLVTKAVKRAVRWGFKKGGEDVGL